MRVGLSRSSGGLNDQSRNRISATGETGCISKPGFYSLFLAINNPSRSRNESRPLTIFGSRNSAVTVGAFSNMARRRVCVSGLRHRGHPHPDALQGRPGRGAHRRRAAEGAHPGPGAASSRKGRGLIEPSRKPKSVAICGALFISRDQTRI